MRLPTEPPGSPSYFMLRHVHQGRRYRVLGIVTTITLLLVCSWAIAGSGANSRSGFGFDYYYDTFFPAPGTGATDIFGQSLIPAKIWQIFLPKMTRHVDHWHEFRYISPEALQVTPSWLALNPDYRYTLVGGDGGTAFVRDHFSHKPQIVEAYNNLTNVGMKSDFLRYLILGVEGGVYTDTDTLAIKPISQWVPLDLRSQARLVVGLEFDKLDGPNWADIPHDLQFCQWTIAAAPNHPVFTKMADRILASLEYLSEVKGDGTPIQDMEFGSFDVMNTTGPAAWTDVVFEQLQEYEPSLNETGDLSGMTEPRLIGDILVLPIDAFGMGQLHSNSTNDGSIPRDALVKHLFTGSWRAEEPPEEEKHEDEQHEEEQHEEEHHEEEHHEEEHHEEEHHEEGHHEEHREEDHEEDHHEEVRHEEGS